MQSWKQDERKQAGQRRSRMTRLYEFLFIENKKKKPHHLICHTDRTLNQVSMLVVNNQGNILIIPG
jgi:hypothetical protein